MGRNGMMEETDNTLNSKESRKVVLATTAFGSSNGLTPPTRNLPTVTEPTAHSQQVVQARSSFKARPQLYIVPNPETPSHGDLRKFWQAVRESRRCMLS